MPFPLRRVLAGFATGAALGWLAGLLRSPGAAPPDSSAGATSRLPQREFGAAPGGAGAPLPPGIQEAPADPAPADPAPAVPAETPTVPEPAAAPAPKKPRARRATPVSDPAAAAAKTLRAGRAAATDRLTETTGGAPADPTKRRVRRTPPPADGGS